MIRKKTELKKCQSVIGKLAPIAENMERLYVIIAKSGLYLEKMADLQEIRAKLESMVMEYSICPTCGQRIGGNK
jgi:hypothetical protein